MEMSFAHSQKYGGPGEETVFIKNFKPPVSLDSKTMNYQERELSIKNFRRYVFLTFKRKNML